MGGEKEEHEVKKAAGLGVRMLQPKRARHHCGLSADHRSRPPARNQGIHRNIVAL
jgi:hypothetical protein